MRAHEVRLLVGLLLRYFRRRVLAVGLLRNPLARVALAAGALAAALAMTGGAYIFLEDTVGDSEVMPLLFRLTSVSVPFWTTVVLVFVKVLFLKSDGIFRFMVQLPVTHRERTAAVSVFEAAIVVGTALAVFAPTLVAAALLDPTGALPGVLFGVVVPVLVAYLLLATLHHLLRAAAGALGLRRVADLASLAVVAALGIAYNVQAFRLIAAISDAYREDPAALGFHGVDGALHVVDVAGPWAALAVSALVVLAAGAAFVATVPHEHPPERRFVALVPGVLGLGWAYAAAVFRRSEFLVVTVLAYLLALYLGARGSAATPFLPAVLASQGVYAYTATAALRALPMRSSSPVREYALLAGSQAAVVVVLSAPIAVFALAAGSSPLTVALGQLGALSGVVVLTYLGILFPPDRDNPFSAFISYGACFVILVLAALVLGVVQLPPYASVLTLVAAHLAMSSSSISGIAQLRRKERHA